MEEHIPRLVRSGETKEDEQVFSSKTTSLQDVEFPKVPLTIITGLLHLANIKLAVR